MKRYLWIWISCLLLAVSFCSFTWAGVGEEPTRKGYKFSENTPHLWLYWNCDRAAQNAIGIEGLVEVKGQSNTPVYGLELKLIGFDAQGNPISEESLQVSRYKLEQSMSFPFHISLPLKGGEADFGLRVYYRYIPAYGGAGPNVSRIAYSMDFWEWTFRELCPKD